MQRIFRKKNKCAKKKSKKLFTDSGKTLECRSLKVVQKLYSNLVREMNGAWIT